MKHVAQGVSAAEAYVGRENLEVMEVAAHYNRWLIALACRALRGERRILDFGAGAGTLTRMLRAQGLDIIAVEPDVAMAANLEREGVATHRNIESIGDGSLDAIVSFNVLEHIEDDARTLCTLRAKLRPGGRFFLYVPAFPVLYSSMDRQVGHFRRYRRGPLQRLLEHSGFRVEECRYADSLGFFASLVYRVFGSSHGIVSRRSVELYDRFAFPLSRMIDSLTAGMFGKNVFAVCTTPLAASRASGAVGTQS